MARFRGNPMHSIKELLESQTDRFTLYIGKIRVQWMGEMPYPGIPNRELANLIRRNGDTFRASVVRDGHKVKAHGQQAAECLAQWLEDNPSQTL